jgi:hypothetical protein
LSFTVLTSDHHVFPIWYVEYLSSLWMFFKGHSIMASRGAACLLLESICSRDYGIRKFFVLLVVV